MLKESYRILTFYKFVQLQKLPEIKTAINNACNRLNVKGTVLLSHEGINSTICGFEQDLVAVCEIIKMIPGLEDIQFFDKASSAAYKPFKKMKVRIKPEIIKFHSVEANKDFTNQLHPEEWNKLIGDPNTIILDTRNHYEYSIGTFKGAIDPNINNFTEFKDWAQDVGYNRSQKVAIFCTGGIRCEKASVWLNQLGFQHVYQLKGGVLNYMIHYRDRQEHSNWNGYLFVFDDRIALDYKLQPLNNHFCS